jgi:nucleoside-diphosphate-sugar epimerase
LPLKQIINSIIGAAGLPPEERSVPLWVALTAGWVFESLERIRPFDDGPPMTRFLARNLASSNWFDISAARRDLGYEASVSTSEGLDNLRAWFDSAS